MAGKRLRKNGTWEYVFKKSGVLSKPIYMTFTSEEEGDAYADRLEKLLDQGIVPTEHLEDAPIYTIAKLVREYSRDAHPSKKDLEKLKLISKRFGDLPLFNITARWVDDWINTMKREENIAPNTIRSRIGALARATDWAIRKEYVVLPDQPLRSLPQGYAQYTELDIALAGTKRVDVERDRRLERGEYEKIVQILDTGIIPRKQRPYKYPQPEAVKMLFTLALETAMRMREMYTLTFGQVSFNQRTIFLDKTKNGDKRQVPMSSVVLKDFKAFIEANPNNVNEDELVFPFWDGKETSLAETSDRLSKLYFKIFEGAGCKDLGFHDLRHEATSRLFERTTMLETKIAKITGHRSMRMLMRYANLRGSTLADEMW